MSDLKNKIITGFMLRVKAFNERHRKCARITTFFALIVLVILRILLGIAEKICDIFTGVFGSGKRMVSVIVTVLLVAAIIAAAVWAKNTYSSKTLVDTEKENDQIVETLVEAELSKTENANKSEEQKVVEDTKKSEEEKSVTEGTQKFDENQSAGENAQDSDKEQGTSDDKQKTEADSKKNEAVQNAGDDAEQAKEEVLVDISEVDLDAFMKEYPETVGWLYFEDGHISYPIMQDGDNEKYRKLGYTGEEARTGAIFLDYRSASDFSDSNSIIYGHYMKDGTMFGTLRDYREDPRYYDDHQYFQVITPDKIYRYQIFAYMDVPKSYVLYDYIGDASYDFVKDAEPVRIKSYMDSEIVVNKTKKVVTLSTCTDKDKLYFVVLGVMVEETDR